MRPTRVLYVENDPALRGILARDLAQCVELELVAAVGSADEALAQARRAHVDVALLDLALGSGLMNGMELGIALRSVIMASDGVHAIEQNQTKAAYLSGSWSTHVSSWLEQEDMPVLLVRYEDLTHQGEQELARILDFLEIPADGGTVAQAVQDCSFGNLVVAELTEGFTEAARPEAPFFRRGTVGTWRDELPAELARSIETDHRDTMRALGYA